MACARCWHGRARAVAAWCWSRVSRGSARRGWWRELAARALEDGFATLWGRCYADEGAPAFRPWTQMLRVFARVDEETRRRHGVVAPYDAAVAVPELAPPAGAQPP